ncbi:MAG: PIN domain-containing protein [Terriglobales bacterium]
MLNLDTHMLVYALAGGLTPAERRLLSREPWSISAIVLWELTSLRRLGRVELDIESVEFDRSLSAVQVWPLDLAVCRRLRDLDIHSDPADEIIAATSLAHQVPLLTRDRKLRRSRVVPLAA